MAPISLDVGELEKRIQERRKRLKLPPDIDSGVIFHPRPGIIGFIIRDPDLRELKLPDLDSAAKDLAKGKGKPGAVLDNDGILVGFFPQDIVQF